MSTTTYDNHWAEALNVTVNDATGGIKNTGGGGASFDASARVEQMFDGRFDLVVEFTLTANVGASAIGIYAQSTAYTRGSVTVASLLACFEVSGANLLAKESNTLRYTGTGEAVAGTKGKIELTAAGVLRYYTDIGAGYVLRHTSAIAASTVLGWRPWRVVATFSAANAEFDPSTITGESDEHYDPDVATNRVVWDHPRSLDFEISGDGTEQPYARAVVM